MSGLDTKYSNLESNLSAIGKEVFVSFYYDFKNFAITTEELSEKLFKENARSKSKKQGFRIPRARHIFETGQQIEALDIIIKSKRVPNEVVEKAKIILKKEKRQMELDYDRVCEQDFIRDINYKQLSLDNEITYEYENVVKKPKGINEREEKYYIRNRAIALNALSLAKHRCEVDGEHFVFLRKNGTTFYTEPHHIVPLYAWKDFPDVDLDREQNIVSLCSNCHNILHYGADIDKILKPIYEKRKDLLKAIGINITYETLKNYYI